MEVKQGDIFEVEIDDGDFRTYLVISNDIMNKNSPTVILVLITNVINKAKLPSHVELKGEEHNLPKDSVVICEQIRTIAKARLIRKLSRIDDETLKKISEAHAFNTFVDGNFFEKVNVARIKFVEDKVIPIKEDYDNEFKEITPDKPFKEVRNYIKEVCIEYVTAFLNHGGGRLLFGIQDKTSIVKGFTLNPEQRDDVSQAINNTLNDSIYPQISTLNYRMEFHDVLLNDNQVLENKYVLEILILPPLDPSVVYYTNKNKIFIRYHEQNRELKYTAITDFILKKSLLKQKDDNNGSVRSN